VAYFTPYIDSAGMHIPTYEDIRDELITQMKTIFGSDIYIDEDSQDYQQISIFAKKIYDTNSLAVLTYNNRTPITAVGVGLDNLCALVGITRNPATYSTVQLTITGSAGTVIEAGQARDENNNLWDLPANVTIPDNGTITVEAQSHVKGYITALPNTITTIATPLYGWTGVTNNYASNPGADEETDAELRGRYSRSTYAPSSTVFEGMISSVEGVDGVTRIKAFENDGNTTSEEGFPPHSLTFVVEGGEDEDVATEIYYKKTPGVYTNGTTVVELTSTLGNKTNIRFYRPTYKEVYLQVTIKKLATYNDDYETQIKQALADYINGLQISEDVYRSILFSVAVSQMGSINSPSYSVVNIQTSLSSSGFADNDIVVAFNEAAITDVSKITVVDADV
jgi:uncharacterized phage protein gp47/JayE